MKNKTNRPARKPPLKKPRKNFDRSKIKMPDPPPAREYEPCPLCGEKITDIFSAINHAGSNKPAHFECVHKQLAEGEELAPGERVAYIGRGNFAVVRDKAGGASKFEIVKVINYEEDEKPQPWRRELSPGISRD